MKISIKSVITIIGLFSGVNLWTMSDQRLTCAVDLSESKREQEREDLNLIPVDLPQTWGPQEKINKEEDETFTVGTFGELMEDQFKRDEEYIIARVVTRDEKDKRYVHYFDAHSLNAHIYGKYPIEKWEIKEKVVNPLNRLKIEDVDYFGIKEGEKSFSFICNSRELLEDRRETLENKFYLNSNNTSLQFNLGNKYYDTRKYKIAEEYYLRVGKLELKKNEGLVQWIQANARLGDIYYYGLGIGSPDNQKKEILQNTPLPKELVHIVSSYLTNYIKAKEYYERVATEDCNIRIRNSPWVRVNNNLGDIYCNGLGLRSDRKKAREYYEKIATVKVDYSNMSLWMNANFKMGETCFFAKDYKKAKEYYERIFKPEYKNENLQVWINSNSRLGDIYYFGRGLLAPDYNKAKEYYERIFKPEYKNENLQVWINSNSRLGDIYYFGRGLLAPDYNKAKEYYENIVGFEYKNEDSLQYSVNANLNMGDIYFNGYGLNNHDYKKAVEYYSKIDTLEFRNQKFSSWIKANIKLSIVYKEIFKESGGRRYIVMAIKCLEKIIIPEVEDKHFTFWGQAICKISEVFELIGDLEKAKEYLEKLITPEIKSKHLGLYIGAITSLKRLSDATVNKLSKLYKAPLSEEFKKARKEFDASIKKRDIELVQALLIKYPTLIIARMHFFPLEYVVEFKNIEMLKVFLNTVSNLIASSFFKKIKSSARKRVNIALKIAKEVEKDQTIQPMTDLLLDWIEKDKSIKEELDIEAESKEEEEDQVI